MTEYKHFEGKPNTTYSSVFVVMVTDTSPSIVSIETKRHLSILPNLSCDLLIGLSGLLAPWRQLLTNIWELNKCLQDVFVYSCYADLFQVFCSFLNYSWQTFLSPQFWLNYLPVDSFFFFCPPSEQICLHKWLNNWENGLELPRQYWFLSVMVFLSFFSHLLVFFHSHFLCALNMHLDVWTTLKLII